MQLELSVYEKLLEEMGIKRGDWKWNSDRDSGLGTGGLVTVAWEKGKKPFSYGLSISLVLHGCYLYPARMNVCVCMGGFGYHYLCNGKLLAS